MNKITYLFLFIIHISFLSLISSQDTNKTINFIPILLKIFESLEYKCYPDLVKLLVDERNMTESERAYPWLGDALSKGLNDIGDESECVKTLQNTSFIMVFFKDLNLQNIVQQIDKELYKFLGLKGYVMGICVMNSCKDTVYRYAKLLNKFLIYLATQKVPKNEDIVSFVENDKLNPNLPNNVYCNDKLDTYVEKLVV